MDFDVAVLSLSVPAASSPLQTYRPAVLVRNKGLHDALASGLLHIYSAGRLIFTSEIYSATIPPGETRPCLALSYWTPTETGKYLFLADATCDHDQIETNNHLPPTTIAITSAPPPPQPPVEPHASQHEEGGADEVLIDGLHGRTADAQAPIAHKADHQLGGSDMLDLTGLTGVLGTPQPIADHHLSHEYGGGDQMNVDGLHGELYNLQKPQIHANEAHDPNFATSEQLSNHLADTTDVHEVATNLEHTANKGESEGYCDLDDNTLVPTLRLAPHGVAPPAEYVLRVDQTWGEATPAAHHVSHEPGGTDPVVGIPSIPTAHKTSHQDGGADEISIAGLSGKAADAQTPDSTLEHKTSHQDGGADEISIAGLSGKAADAQDPTGHGNTAHTSTFEDQANKGAASGYCPLDATTKVPLTYLPASIAGNIYVHDRISEPTSIAAGINYILQFATGNQLGDQDQIEFSVSGVMSNPGLVNNFRIHVALDVNQSIGLMEIPVVTGDWNYEYKCRLSFWNVGGGFAKVIGSAKLFYTGPNQGAVCKSETVPLDFVFNAAQTLALAISLFGTMTARITHARLDVYKA